MGYFTTRYYLVHSDSPVWGSNRYNYSTRNTPEASQQEDIENIRRGFKRRTIHSIRYIGTLDNNEFNSDEEAYEMLNLDRSIGMHV